jgi:hypothetical protein
VAGYDLCTSRTMRFQGTGPDGVEVDGYWVRHFREDGNGARGSHVLVCWCADADVLVGGDSSGLRIGALIKGAVE